MFFEVNIRALHHHDANTRAVTLQRVLACSFGLGKGFDGLIMAVGEQWALRAGLLLRKWLESASSGLLDISPEVADCADLVRGMNNPVTGNPFRSLSHFRCDVNAGIESVQSGAQ